MMAQPAAVSPANHFYFSDVLRNNGLEFVVRLGENGGDPLLRNCDWDKISGALKIHLPLNDGAVERSAEVIREFRQSGITLSRGTVPSVGGKEVPVLSVATAAVPAGEYYSAFALTNWLSANGEFGRAVGEVYARVYETADGQAAAMPKLVLADMDCHEITRPIGNKEILESPVALLYKVGELASLSIPLSDITADKRVIMTSIDAFATENYVRTIHLRSGDKTVVQLQIPVEDYDRLKEFAVGLGLKINPEK